MPRLRKRTRAHWTGHTSHGLARHAPGWVGWGGWASVLALGLGMVFFLAEGRVFGRVHGLCGKGGWLTAWLMLAANISLINNLFRLALKMKDREFLSDDIEKLCGPILG